MNGSRPGAAKRVLILQSSLVDAESVAAHNLLRALRLPSSGASADVVDLSDRSGDRLPDLLRHSFRTAFHKAPRLWSGFCHFLGSAAWLETQLDGLARLRHSLRDTLESHSPDVVVVTNPIYGALIPELFQDGRVRDFPVVALVASPLADMRSWARSGADVYSVCSDRAAEQLEAAGVTFERIKVLGFPVEPRGGSPGEIPRLSDPPRILCALDPEMGRKKTAKLLARLREGGEWRISLLVPSGAKLQELARSKAQEAPDRFEVLKGDRPLPELLRCHHLVVGSPGIRLVSEALAAACPMVAWPADSAEAQAHFAPFREANGGALATKPREVAEWLDRAFHDGGRLWKLWRRNLQPLAHADASIRLADFLVSETEAFLPGPRALRPLAAVLPREGDVPVRRRSVSAAKKLLLCDLHTHTTWSDGKLSVGELVDFYGQRGFDCLCITDHLCDPKRLLGKLVNLTGLVIPPAELDAYFAEIEREKARAWAKYDLLLMTGLEFNKDGYTAKTSAHLLGIDLTAPIDPSLDLPATIAEIQAQGGLAIASHPHEIKSEWGKNTLYLWEHVDEFAPLLDAWEVANRDDIFNPVGLKKLPFVANSDFHKPKHIHSWKTLLFCEKEAEAIKQCIRINRDVSITLYRDRPFGAGEPAMPWPPLETLALDDSTTAAGRPANRLG